MHKPTVNKLSLLGIVLMTASAVVAAVMPSENKDEDMRLSGKLQASSLSPFSLKTCITLPSGQFPDCDHTETKNDHPLFGSSTSDNASGSASANNNATLSITTL